MTILCWDGSVLAADSMATLVCEGRVAYYQSKIMIVKQVAVACAGAVPSCDKFVKWVEEGMDSKVRLKLDEDFAAFLLTKEKLYMFTSNGELCEVKSRESLGHDAAIHYANAAMDFGRDAIDAVYEACQYSIYCGGFITFINQSELESFPPDFVGLLSDAVHTYSKS